LTSSSPAIGSTQDGPMSAAVLRHQVGGRIVNAIFSAFCGI
jgi:hypothetical protein